MNPFFIFLIYFVDGSIDLIPFNSTTFPTDLLTVVTTRATDEGHASFEYQEWMKENHPIIITLSMYKTVVPKEFVVDDLFPKPNDPSITQIVEANNNIGPSSPSSFVSRLTDEEVSSDPVKYHITFKSSVTNIEEQSFTRTSSEMNDIQPNENVVNDSTLLQVPKSRSWRKSGKSGGSLKKVRLSFPNVMKYISNRQDSITTSTVSENENDINSEKSNKRALRVAFEKPSKKLSKKLKDEDTMELSRISSTNNSMNESSVVQSSIDSIGTLNNSEQFTNSDSYWQPPGSSTDDSTASSAVETIITPRRDSKWDSDMGSPSLTIDPSRDSFWNSTSINSSMYEKQDSSLHQSLTK
ncbi:hypothetical protein SNEBB_007437 [Seison nebaliae]|nr:hypothetical protein SNEBB_007437 [Seison nebaliae]